MPRQTADVERAAVSIQQAQHEQSSNTMDFVKALLMWVATPEERVEAIADSASFQQQPPPSQAH